MKKLLFSIALVAALATSCRKENESGPDRPDTDKQAVVLGSKMTGMTTTKSSIDSVQDWIKEGFNLYVLSINDSTSVETERTFINNAPASVTRTSDTTGTLNFNETYYYGVSEKDIYSFYAYYLGYNRGAGDPGAVYEGDSISIEYVNIHGNNDIMTAVTNKYEDAHVTPTEMVNPKIIYSGRSARLGVVPNLRFSHSLSKFVFGVQVGGIDSILAKNKMTLDSITMDSPTQGRLTIVGNRKGIVPTGAKSDLKLEGVDSVDLTYDLQPVGKSLMLAPAGKENYTLKIYCTETFNKDSTVKEKKSMVMTQTIKPSDVVIPTGGTAENFESGKQYKVEITVYGFQKVKVNVQLQKWDEAGTITVDPDKGTEGKIEGPVVKAAMGGNTFYLQLVKDKAVTVDDPVVDVKTGSAPADGEYVINPSVVIEGATISKLTIEGGVIKAIE